MSDRIGIYGAGAWGSALALTAARTGAEVLHWAAKQWRGFQGTATRQSWRHHAMR